MSFICVLYSEWISLIRWNDTEYLVTDFRYKIMEGLVRAFGPERVVTTPEIGALAFHKVCNVLSSTNTMSRCPYYTGLHQNCIRVYW